MHKGWLQLAFERDLDEGLNEAWAGAGRVALVKAGRSVRAVDAVCPHRGANLCGGRLVEGAIRCPFHGLRIELDDPDEAGTALRARPLECLSVGGLVFVREPSGPDAGLAARMAAMDESSFIVAGFEMDVSAPAELVIENAFDALHFDVVHGLGGPVRLSPVSAPPGYAAEGAFRLPPSPWQGVLSLTVPYRATAYSPGIVISDLGGPRPYSMITAAVPTGPRDCRVRLSLVLPAGPQGQAPANEECRYLLEGARRGLREDAVIWEGLAEQPPFEPIRGDEAVQGFREFCRTFA
jgi:nitrite reductase/ring-hydroxylating ferredoxin subunit